MENEYLNNAKIPSPDDFWPDAKDVLDKHYAARKRRIVLFYAGFAVLMVSLGIVFFNGNKNEKLRLFANSNPELNKTTLVVNETQLTSEKVVSNPQKKIVKSTINEPLKNLKYQTENTSIVASNTVKNSNNVSNTSAIKKEKELIFNKQENEVETNQQSTVEEEIITQENSISITKRIDLISILSIPVKRIENSSDINLNEKKYPESMIPIDDYVGKKKQFNYFLTAYSGLQSVDKNIKTDLALKEYADIRNASEHKVNNLFYGLNFTMEKNGFTFTSGAEYNKSGETNSYAAQSKQWLKSDEKVWDVYNRQIIKIDTVYHFGIVNYHETVINVKDSTLLSKSDSVFVYDTDSNIVKANGKTTLSYLEIPLLIGYQFKFGKCAISPTAGIAVGYLTQAKGMYLNKSLTGIETITESKVISNFSLSYMFKLQLSYAIKSNIMVFISPQYKSNLNSVSPKASGISTKYTSVGASLGVCYKL